MLKKFSFLALALLVFGAGCQQPIGNEWDTRTAPDGTQWEVHDESGKLKSVLDEEQKTIDGEPVFGAGFAPVTGYQTQTTARVSASATTIPVASVTDKAGNLIVPSLISSSSTVRMYFNFEAGTTREEPFLCTGISGLNLTGCTRGLSFQGADLTGSSTIAQVHNAGSSIIMTNLGVMYGNEFVGTSGDQTVFDTKTFASFPRTTSTTATPVTAADFATKYYVDNVGAGGFTSANVSSTLGLQAITSGVPACTSAAACVGLYASTTASLTGGFLNFNNLGQVYWNVVNFLAGNWTWAGVNTFASIIANSTPDNLQIVGTPDTTSDAINLGAQVQFYATGSSGVAITAGDALRVGGDGNLYLTNANATNTVYEFYGVAQNSVSGAGQTVRVVRPGGIFTSSTSIFGSAVSQPVFLSDSNGDFTALTPGTIPANIGLSLSSNSFLVKQPTFFASSSSRVTIALAGTTAPEATLFNTIWVPKRVKISCSDLSADNAAGEWNMMANGASSTFSLATDFLATNTSTCAYNNANIWTTLRVATSTGGFTVWGNHIGAGHNVTAFITAETW